MTQDQIRKRLVEMMHDMERRAPYNGLAAFVWQDSVGTDGVRYGSYRLVSLPELMRREFVLEWLDAAPSVFWLDQIYHCGLRRPVRLPTLN